MGSGAFLVEACRALVRRLVRAWAALARDCGRDPDDEDEPLHAAPSCRATVSHGVDKNPRAVPSCQNSRSGSRRSRAITKFTFLDHALKKRG